MKKERKAFLFLNYLLLRNVMLFALSIPLIYSFYGCSEKTAQGKGFSMPPMPAEVAEVKTQKVADKFEALGSIGAIEEITVVSEIDASVISLPFPEGGFINKGQLIAQLDDSQLNAEVLRTEAIYKQSEANYNRVKEVVKQDAGTPREMDDAAAAMKVAEANLLSAKARLSKTRIVAPFSGMIGARKVSVGTFLRTGQAITELANLNEIRVSFSAPEGYLAQLKRGGEVNISSPVYPGYEVKGKILSIEPVLDYQTRNAQIVARVTNPGQKLRPGMSANVSAILSERTGALTIPTEAVFASGNQSFVFIVKADSSVMQVPVTLGLQLPDVVEVVQGLQQGMKVVQAGHQKLFPGAKIIPVTKEATAQTQAQ